MTYLLSLKIKYIFPTEMQYADDTDLLFTSHIHLEEVMDVLDKELQQRQDTKVQVHHDGIEWWKVKTLGSLLGEEEDVARRIQLATVAFQQLLDCLLV